MARQKELESPTFRLGGGRSIQLSYWRIYWNIVAENKIVVNRRIQQDFGLCSHILCFRCRKEGGKMRECNDPNVDLEDLLFDEDAGGPSER